MWAGSLGTGDGSGGKTFQSGLRPWVRVGTVDCESLKSERSFLLAGRNEVEHEVKSTCCPVAQQASSRLPPIVNDVLALSTFDTDQRSQLRARPEAPDCTCSARLRR